jgi:hypothetical protein
MKDLDMGFGTTKPTLTDLAGGEISGAIAYLLAEQGWVLHFQMP